MDDRRLKERGNTAILIIIVLLLVVSMAGNFYLFTQFMNKDTDSIMTTKKSTDTETDVNKETEMAKDDETTESESAPSEESAETEDKKRTLDARVFEFDYPESWHVAFLWNDREDGPTQNIVVNPKPVNTAPRGGPLGQITIADYSGNSDPESLIQDLIDDYKGSLSSYSEETFDVSGLEVTHIEGETNIFGETHDVENYFVKIPGRDAINTHILVFQRNPFSTEYSDVLNEIILSLRSSS